MNNREVKPTNSRRPDVVSHYDMMVATRDSRKEVRAFAGAIVDISRQLDRIIQLFEEKK